MSASTRLDKIRFQDIVLAEITKIISHPMLLIALAITVFFNLSFAIIEAIGISFYVATNQAPATISSFGVVMFFPVYAFLMLPVIAAGSEYKDGQYRMTLTAIPNRQMLMAGKFTAMIVTVISAALVVLVPARLVIGVSGELSLGAIMIDIARWMTVYLLMSVIAFGLAGFMRSTIAPLAILMMLPIFVATGVLQWPEGLRFLPDQASMSLLGTPAYDVTKLPVQIALIALLCWAVLWTLTYWLSLVKRDS